MDWRERYERAAARYEEGETRELDERQLVQLANAAWAAGLSLLMAGERESAAEWLLRSAARYRESWDAGVATDAWGRPIAAMKALLIAGADASGAARWTLDVGAGEAESPIGRYAGVLALLVLDRDEEEQLAGGAESRHRHRDPVDERLVPGFGADDVPIPHVERGEVGEKRGHMSVRADAEQDEVEGADAEVGRLLVVFGSARVAA